MPLRGGASVLSSLVHADALLTIPADCGALPAAAPVDAELWRGGSDPDGALLLAGAPERALDLLAIVFAERQERRARVAFCELPADDAAQRVRDGFCHVVAVAGSADSRLPSDSELVSVRLTECNVGVVVAADRRPLSAPAELLGSGLRVAVGPHGTPGRRVLDEAVREIGPGGLEIVEARSDAAALATVAGGRADLAVTTVPAARHAGLDVTPLGRAAIDLRIHRGVATRDPLIRALLETLRSPSLAMALERAGYGGGGGPRRSTKRDRALKSRVVGELRRSKVKSRPEPTA
jgi:putative molybdopterin biosynthesis protein